MKKLITWLALGCLSVSTTVVCAQEVQSHSSSSRYQKTSVRSNRDGSQNGDNHRNTYRQSRSRHVHVTRYGNGNNRTREDRTTTTTRHDVRP